MILGHLMIRGLLMRAQRRLINRLLSRISGLGKRLMQALLPLKLANLKSLYWVLELMIRERGLMIDQANPARTSLEVTADGDRLASIAMPSLKKGWIDISRKLREVGTVLKEGGRQIQEYMNGGLRTQIFLTTSASSMSGA